MLKISKNFLVTALFLVLFSLMPQTSVVSPDSMSSTTIRDVTLPGSDSYYDSLISMTYYDAGNTTASGWGSGSVYNPRVSGLDYLGTFNPPNDDVYTVELQGRKLYISTYAAASSTDTILVYDVTDPTNPRKISDYSSSDQLISGEIDGDLYFSGDYEGYLRTYNVSDPTSISFVDSITYAGGPVTDIEVQGRFMYVALWNDGGHDLRIYDISDPANPYPTDSGSYSNLQGLAVQGDVLYTARTSDMRTYNVTDPYNYVHKDTLSLSGNVTDLIVEGDVAYVACGLDGVVSVDCGDITNLAVLDTVDTYGRAVDVELQGDTLIVADTAAGLSFIDVSDPEDLRYYGYLPIDTVHDVSIQDGLLAVGTKYSVYLYSLGELSGLPIYSTFSTYDAIDVDVQGDIAYIAAGTDGLVVLDVSDKANPVLLDQIKEPGTCNYTGVDVHGIHCWVSNYDTGSGGGDDGLYCFDVSQPNNVAYLDVQTRGSGYDVVIANDVAYYANGQYGMYTMNVTDPWNFGTFLEESTSPSYCNTVDVQGHFAYAGGYDPVGSDRGVVSFWANTTNLLKLDQIAFVDVFDIDVCGDIMAVANGYWGVNVCNISDPWNMDNAGGINYGGLPVTAVALFGNYFFAGRTGSGIYLINATDHTSPTQLALYGGASDVRNLHIDGDFLYVANGINGLQIRRVYNSQCDTWDTTTRYAQSLEIDTTDRTIENATLTYAIGIDFGDSGASVSWQLSANGGFNWESVVGGVPHTFTNQGNKLLWRATLSSSYNDRTPYIGWVDIDYEYNDLPSAPVLTNPGSSDNDGAFTVSWTASVDDGSAPTYLLQMSDSSSFTTILDSWTPSTTSQALTGLTNDTYYFRVQGLDDDGEYGAFSNTESITVAIPPTTTTTTTTTTPPPPIPGFPIAAIVIGVCSALGLTFVSRRRNLRKQ